MNLKTNILKRIVFSAGAFVIAGVLSGCLHLQVQPPPAIVNEGCVILEKPYADGNAEIDFNKAVQQLGSQIEKTPDKDLKASLHLGLVSVYMDYRNPKPNYPSALKEVDTYISMAGKDDVCMYEAKNLKRVLDWITQAEIVLRKQINVLEKEKGILVTEINQCREDVAKLREDVGRLQELDINMEQRRREFR